MSTVDQKEYLKKYLGLGKGTGEKKKKKKKTKKLGNNLKIVDDNDFNLNYEIKQDLEADNEDAPQIVSIIDDRPPSLRTDEITKANLWIPLGAPDEVKQESSVKFEGSIKLAKVTCGGTTIKSEFLRTNVKKEKRSNDKQLKKEKDSSKKNDNGTPNQVKREELNSAPSSSRNRDNTPSPPVRIKIEKEDDYSPPRKNGDSTSTKNEEVDFSPPRKVKSEESEVASPPRRNRRAASEDNSPSRKSRLNEISPTRNTKREKSEDNSSPRRSGINGHDLSPPRKTRKIGDNISPPRRSKYSENDISPPRKIRKDDDMSPPRRVLRKKTPDISPPRRSRKDSDSSPPRRRNQENDEDMSPPRRRRATSPARRKPSPSSRSKTSSRWGNWEDNEKLGKTLDGKTAGLQNAAELVKETEALKKREETLFQNLSAEVSGKNAATVVRKKKEKEVDEEEEERKRRKEQETKQKYDRWGKGLKQVEDVHEKIKNDLYEMSKPLARYADDEDLEKYLKDQEREGDPMLQYIRQKKKKKAVVEGKPVKQQYEGDAPPNRFGIRPGYRWDGVDRANGYEKQWFEAVNARTANVEDSYKWSIEDM